MSMPAGVLVVLEGRARAGAAMAAGAELARLLRLPLRGLVMQDPALAEIGRLAAATGAVRAGSAVLMTVAMAREARSLAAEFETVARSAGLAASVEARQGEPGGVLAACAGEAEAVVIPVDPADRGAEGRIVAAMALSARCAAVLLAPARPRRGPGVVLSLGPAEGLAARLAAALRAPLVEVGDESEALMPWGPGGVRPPRLVSVPACTGADRIAALLRRWRAPVLVLPRSRA